MTSTTAPQLHYQNTAKQARVLGANAHELISILLEELLNLLDEMAALRMRNDQGTIRDQQVMALTILDSLIISLDLDRGGDLAKNLELIYREVRKLIAANDNVDPAADNRAAHQIITEIFDSWRAIA